MNHTDKRAGYFYISNFVTYYNAVYSLFTETQMKLREQLQKVPLKED